MGAARRTRAQRGIYYRDTQHGRRYEVVFRDSDGRQRWRTIGGFDNLDTAEEARRCVTRRPLGRYNHSTGYTRILALGHPMADARGIVLEHRLVMAERIGRMLEPEEHVHHANENRADNRPENLWLWPNKGSHTAWHTMQRRGHGLRVSMPAVLI